MNTFKLIELNSNKYRREFIEGDIINPNNNITEALFFKHIEDGKVIITDIISGLRVTSLNNNPTDDTEIHNLILKEIGVDREEYLKIVINKIESLKDKIDYSLDTEFIA